MLTQTLVGADSLQASLAEGDFADAQMVETAVFESTESEAAERATAEYVAAESEAAESLVPVADAIGIAANGLMNQKTVTDCSVPGMLLTSVAGEFAAGRVVWIEWSEPAMAEGLESQVPIAASIPAPRGCQSRWLPTHPSHAS